MLAGSFCFRCGACTNFIVTPGASADGSLMVSYAADSHTLYGELYFREAADWKEGEMRKVFDWDTGRYLCEIPQAAHTYKRVGNMNEHQMIITETTFGGRPELVDRYGGLDYGSLIHIALERCRSAREAITLIAELVEQEGYYSEGETFTIADSGEVWIMEIIGKGVVMKNGRNLNKGAVWVAVKVPDGYVCCHANQSRITTFPLQDSANCMYSKDVISFARKMGYYSGPDDEFSFADAYCPLDFSGMRACEARVWSAFNIASGGWFRFEDNTGRMVTKDAYSFIDHASGLNAANRLPLWIQPEKKLTVKDVADIMRDHFEGTPFDMTGDIGAGGNALPYRFRPLTYEVDGKKYVNERAIATQQTGFWMVGQVRPKMPDVIGGVLWFGTDDTATSYLTPLYTNITKVPECFREGNGDLMTYSPTSSFWINNRVANACYKMYNQMAPFVRKEVDDFENGQLKAINEVEDKAIDEFQKIAMRELEKAAKKGYRYNPMTDTGDTFASVKKILTNYSVSTAQKQFDKWVELETVLLVKFLDGNVKKQNRDGSFVHSEFSKRMPADPDFPGYTDTWKEHVAGSTGEHLQVRK